jgi:hypothetical protein
MNKLNESKIQIFTSNSLHATNQFHLQTNPFHITTLENSSLECHSIVDFQGVEKVKNGLLNVFQLTSFLALWLQFFSSFLIKSKNCYMSLSNIKSMHFYSQTSNSLLDKGYKQIFKSLTRSIK